MTNVLDAPAPTVLLNIPLDQIRPGDNDRKDFDEADLFALSQSIAKLGQLTPILVRPVDGPVPYEIVGGERRWRAHQLAPCVNAGITTIDAIVRHLDDDATSASMLAENTGRVDLKLFEEARAYARQRDGGLTVDQIAEQSGVARFRVVWRLELVDLLIPEAQQAISSGLIPPGPAHEICKLDANRQIVAVKAWLKNPSMGHFPFRKLCEAMAAAQFSDDQVGLFADQETPWIDQAAAIKPKTFSIAALRKMIGRLADHLEAAGIETSLLTEAREMA